MSFSSFFFPFGRDWGVSGLWYFHVTLPNALVTKMQWGKENNSYFCQQKTI